MTTEHTKVDDDSPEDEITTEHTKVEIEEHLVRMAAGEVLSDDLIVQRLAKAYREHRQAFEAMRKQIKGLASAIKKSEDDLLKLEGKTNATGALLREFYTKSLSCQETAQ